MIRKGAESRMPARISEGGSHSLEGEPKGKLAPELSCSSSSDEGWSQNSPGVEEPEWGNLPQPTEHDQLAVANLPQDNLL